MDQLRTHGREHWLQADFDGLTQEDLYRPDPALLWQRISGVQKLRRKQLAVLRELTAWREQQAQTLNRPRKWILPDNLLIAIATQAPTTAQKLTSIRGINEGIISKQGNSILQSVSKALALPESEWPQVHKRHQLSKDQEAVVDALLAIVKLLANAHSLNVSAITSRNELEALLDDTETVPVMTGWRRELVGNTLLTFLNGNSFLRYQQGKLVLVDKNE
jgi:ribonuclease D